jgi:proteasome accessory factor A
VELSDGRKVTALQIQLEYCQQARKFVEDRYGADADAETLDVLSRWESVLDRLADDPRRCSEELDWVAKSVLLEGFRDRDGLEWSAPKLQAVDLQYSDVRPEKSLYQRLVKAGRMQRLLADGPIQEAVTRPPENTRAYFRGECLRRYADQVVAASWDSVIFDVPGHDSLQRVPTLEPLRGTKAHVGGLLERSKDATALVDALTGGQ